MAFVLDASIALNWLFEDEANDYAESLLRRLGREEVFVPSIWTLEVTNALLAASRNRRLTAERLASVRLELAGLPVTLAQESVATIVGPVFDTAARFGLTTYDATYLSLAANRRVPLATADRRLGDAARELGVPLA